MGMQTTVTIIGFISVHTSLILGIITLCTHAIMLHHMHCDDGTGEPTAAEAGNEGTSWNSSDVRVLWHRCSCERDCTLITEDTEDLNSSWILFAVGTALVILGGILHVIVCNNEGSLSASVSFALTMLLATVFLSVSVGLYLVAVNHSSLQPQSINNDNEPKEDAWEEMTYNPLVMLSMTPIFSLLAAYTGLHRSVQVARQKKGYTDLDASDLQPIHSDNDDQSEDTS